MSNIIKAYLHNSRAAVTAALHQWDYGQVLQIIGPVLPDTYEVHFSSTMHGGEATTSIGDAAGVIIPDVYLTTGGNVYAWVYLHTGDDDGETEYTITIPVPPRAKPTDYEPTPVQHDAIAQAIAALNEAVDKTAADVEATEQSKQEAAGYAENAAQSAAAALASEESAAGHDIAAQGYAEAAAGSAESARLSAENAAQSAENAAQSATNAAGSAQTAAQNANNAYAAKTDAIAASGVANSARAAAVTAQGKAEAAQAAAETAQTAAETAQGKAENAQEAAETAKDAAEAAAASLDADEIVYKGLFGDALDAVFTAMVDGENTTKLFEQYMPVVLQEGNRYDAMERFFTILGKGWADKVYTLRGPDYRENATGITTLMPLADLAGKEPAQLCTDETEPVADWADEDPMTWYCRANALSLADGSMDVLAIEGIDDTFDITGNLAPVYTFRTALWRAWYTDDTYEYKSFATVQKNGMSPWAAAVRPDNTVRPMVWEATFCGSLTADGKLTSGVGNTLAINYAASTGLTSARRWNAYEGVYSETDADVILDLWQMRHFNLGNSGILEGCTSYYLDYTVAMAEEGVRSFVITATQGANILIGSAIDLGTAARGGQITRAKVLSKEDFTQDGGNYTRVYLDAAADFDVAAGTHAATLPWFPGNTEALPGHKDGSTISLTSGKTPARIAGVEILDGAYAVGLDPLWNSNWDANRDPKSIYTVYACRDSEKQASSITTNYVQVGTFTGPNSGWQYIKHLAINNEGMLMPDAPGAGSSTFMKSAFSFGGSAGVRAPWCFGNLNSGGGAGLACARGSSTPGYAYWGGRPRLAGSGKKRGVWAEGQ